MSRVTQPRVYRPKRSGSPPLWGYYEYQTSASEHSECDSCSESESEEESEEEANRSESGASGAGSERDDEHEQAQRLKEKGKQPEDIRRKQRAEPKHRRVREPVYRPILTIRRSEGFVWNQDLFLPSYIRDRYVATSPNSSSFHSGNTSTCDSSFSGMDFEIECVDIHVDGKGILSGLESTTNAKERE
ncbi:hypothetical protein RSOLAG1IB_01299 [Rhizoctonia solani AG-1 IB]|uniref:Uncharacterized protein n=2 Tax=Rhizoctonia solani TaxID=456999 RepID=M5BSP3_THACB|nr:unnamed protein product [Rhizoctonia solani]CCO30778.1 hypothetical protein BN14_04810 [Rhizoctonia solani AG-1 IB]CEL55290.1 hypothetical protein RSOLAG1IB_01299 [Rhizoctonia solani AG-1 IB]